MKKQLGFVKKICIGAGIVGGLAYRASPKMGAVQHTVAKEITDSLGNLSILADQETNDIINLLSGKMTQEELYVFLKKHNRMDEYVDVASLGEKDEAMRKAMRYMQTKYGNPLLHVDGNFYNIETGESEYKRARINPLTNTISLMKLDSVPLKIPEAMRKDENRMRQHFRYPQAIAYTGYKQTLLESWLKELTHIKQLHRDGVFKRGVNYALEYAYYGFDNTKQYHIPGTTEYEAHTDIEQELITEFCSAYERYADPKDPVAQYAVAKLYAGTFPKFFSLEKAYEYMQKSANNGYHVANYGLGKYYYTHWKTLQNPDDPLILQGKVYTKKKLFAFAKAHYTKAYEGGNLDAGLDLVMLMASLPGKLYDKEIIALGEKLKEHKEVFSEQKVYWLYRTLIRVYMKQGKREKAIPYQEYVHDKEQRGSRA